jgi:hypothetical protein
MKVRDEFGEYEVGEGPTNLGWLFFRCPICRRRGWRGILWHGTASELRTVMVHKPCGLAASAEFIRGLEMGAPPATPTPPT